MKKSAFHLLLTFNLLFATISVSAQKNWYYGLEGGANLGFMNKEAAQVGGLATQGGFVFGRHRPTSKWYVEYGINVARHAMDYKYEFPSKKYVGNAYDRPFRYQVMEFPVQVGRVVGSTGKIKYSVFGGARLLVFAFRPYAEPSPWDIKYESYAKSVYILPDSPNGERRYWQADGWVSNGLNVDFGVRCQYALTDRWTVRGSMVYSQGLWFVDAVATGFIDVVEAKRDEFGVLVPTNGDIGFYVGSRGTNLAINICLIYQ